MFVKNIDVVIYFLFNSMFNFLAKKPNVGYC